MSARARITIISSSELSEVFSNAVDKKLNEILAEDDTKAKLETVMNRVGELLEENMKLSMQLAAAKEEIRTRAREPKRKRARYRLFRVAPSSSSSSDPDSDGSSSSSSTSTTKTVPLKRRDASFFDRVPLRVK